MTTEGSAASDRHPPFLVPHPVYGHLEYVMPVSVKAVIDYLGQIPLLRNERDEWELPGGKLEVDEALEDTVRREVHEELGLTIEDLNLAHAWVYPITPQRHVLVIAYAARYRGSETPQVTSEHKELGLFAPEEIAALNMPEPYKQAIRNSFTEPL
ncbi:NUDIX hydrolase [Catenulispora sp. NF23]|uniref:NUDIX hydrolase n=1 Tax=Catenulispora pinistramenti TaxID=2705254 RepID=UPI001BA684D8|nr:NUDIX hydrolase [Catenulispora pinistramenti]MBS2532571.1 NUDIX hydrolase [Catenulispora pinistramenti]